jgi:catechol 2,3-dioxygenase
MAKNPHYLSQMAHVELLSTDLNETVRFYTDIVGMDETARDDNSVYLRAWGDYFLYTLKITQSETKGLGTVGWRADSPEALEEAVAYLESIGKGIGWVEADKGRGKAYRFFTTVGIMHEIFWDVVWHKDTGARKSVFADRYASNNRKGACPRRFDHITYLVAKGSYAFNEKPFWQGMGLKNPDEIRMEDHIPPIGGLWTIGNLSHDIAVFSDPNLPEGQGILNHICYNVDSREEVLLAIFFYIMEPHTGILLEIYACARLIFAPDHGPDIHYLRDNPNDAWGLTNPFAEAAKSGKVGGVVNPVDI